MGARTAMTIACRYPDRIDLAISVDAAPVNEVGNEIFRSFTYGVVSTAYMLIELAVIP